MGPGQNRQYRPRRIALAVGAAVAFFLTASRVCVLADSPESKTDRARELLRSGDLASARKALRDVVQDLDDGAERDRALLDLLLASILGDAPDYRSAREVERLLESSSHLAGSFELHLGRAIVRRQAAVEKLASPRTGDLAPHVLAKQQGMWRYFKGTNEPPGSWTAVSFDDSSWTSGQGPLGFGDADDTTHLDDMKGKYSTLYLRRKFELAPGSLARVVGLRIQTFFDDGFVAYVNGKEIARVNASGRRGTVVAHSSTATSQHEALEYEDHLVPSSCLVEGVNVLAVQGINYTIGSADFTLDAALVAIERRRSDDETEVARLIATARSSLEAASGLSVDRVALERIALERIALDILAGELADAVSRLGALRDSRNGATRRTAAYLESLALLAEGRHLAAGRAVERMGAFDAGTESSHARYVMARIYRTLGRRHESIALLDRLVDEGVGGNGAFPVLDARLRRGIALFEVGDLPRAVVDFTGVAERGKGTQIGGHAGLFRGIALLRTNEADAAHRELVRISRTVLDTDLQARSILWASRAVRKRLASAESWMAGELRARAIDLLDQGRLIEPSPRVDRELARERADTLFDIGKTDEAATEYAEIAARGAGGDLRPAYRSIVALQVARRYLESEKLCRRLLRFHPGSEYSTALEARAADARFLQALDSKSPDSVEFHLTAAVSGYRRSLRLGGLAQIRIIRFRLALAALLRGDPVAAEAELARIAIDPESVGFNGPPPEFLTTPYLRARLLQQGVATNPTDAIEAGQALQQLDRSEKLLEQFLGLQGTDPRLRVRASLALVSSLRRRGELLREQRERRQALLRAAAIVRSLRLQLRSHRLGAYTYLEEGLVLAAQADLRGASQRLGSFLDEVPWKESPLAPRALFELFLVQERAGRAKDSQQALDAARDRLPRDWVDGDTSMTRTGVRITLAQARKLVASGETGRALELLGPLLQGGLGESARVDAGLIELSIRTSGPVQDDRANAVGDLVSRLDRSARSLSNDAPSRAADLLLGIARFHQSRANDALLEDAARRIVASVGSADRRGIEATTLAAGRQLARGRVGEAVTRIESAYSSNLDPGIDADLLLRRAACLLVAGKVVEAERELAEISTQEVELKAVARVGLAVGARRRGREDLAKSHLEGLRRPASASGKAVPRTFVAGSAGGVASLADAVSAVAVEDAAAVYASTLLATPLRVRGSLSPGREGFSDDREDFFALVSLLGPRPFPLEEIVPVDPLEFTTWLRIEPEPPLLPLLDPPSAEILRFSLLSGDGSDGGDSE